MNRSTRQFIGIIGLPAALLAVMQMLLASKDEWRWLVAITAVSVVLAVVATLATAGTFRRRILDPRRIAVVPSAAAGAGVALAMTTTGSGIGVPPAVGWMIGALVAAILAYVIHPGREPAPLHEEASGVAGATEVLVDQARLQRPWSQALGVVGLLTVGLLLQAGIGFIISFAIIAYSILASFGMTLTIGPEAVVARGLVGWPRITIDRTRISNADVVDVKTGPWRFGWIPMQSAMLTRSGPALRIIRTDGSTFTITISEPARAADLISRAPTEITGHDATHADA